MTVVDCVLDAKALVGEGAMWDERQQSLWWVDIDGRSLHASIRRAVTTTRG